MPPIASQRGSRDFRNRATTAAEEAAYDFRAEREHIPTIKFVSTIGSVAHVIKSALGGGILSAHVAYIKGGIAYALPLNFLCGCYMCFCFYLLGTTAQILYRRTRIPIMSYADVGEAACMMCPSPKLQNFSKIFRYIIDALVCLELFGACACYQLIISKQVKQLVENTHVIQMAGKGPGYWDLRVYVAVFIPLLVAICLIRYLKYLAPFSMMANGVILVACIMTIYYAFEYNPHFDDLIWTTTPYGIFQYIGMAVFSMSCIGVVIPVENNLHDPLKFPFVITVGMFVVVMFLMTVAFFGASAFGEKCVTPLTLNFPMTLGPKILKGLIAIMIYVTHALNFWVPFNLCFYYIKKLHKPERHGTIELIYRAVFVIVIGLVAIVFPEIDALMGFIGCFALSNMAFIWPNLIHLMTIWERPGLGAYNWRLWRGVFLMGIGLFIFICGSSVTAQSLLDVFIKENIKK